MRFKIALPLLFATSLTSSTAFSGALCEYAAFTPAAMQRQLTAALAARGLAIVPASYFTERVDDAELAVVGNGHLYGHLRWNRTLAGAHTSLLVEDAQGSLLAQAGTDLYACPGGWCRAMDFTTVIDHADSATFEDPALRLTQDPSYGLRYVVYGQEIGVTSWRTQYDDRMDWLVAALSDESVATSLASYSHTQRFMVALAGVPDVAPYLGLIRIMTARDGHLVLRGRMPHGIYNLIIDTALANGFYTIEPDVIIDSAAYAPPVGVIDDPDLQRCFGW